MTPTPHPEEFTPDWSVHPGEFLRQVLEQRGIRQSELAERTGLTAKHINQIVTKNIGISGEVAVLLERVLAIDATWWTRVDAEYQAYLGKQKARISLHESLGWVKQFDKLALQRYGITDTTDDAETTVEKVFRFFGVASPEAFERTWLRPRVSFRRSQAFTVAEQNTALWLRLVERSAEHYVESVDLPTLRPGALRKASRAIPAMTTLTVPDGFTAARAMLAEAGVALTFVPEISGTRVWGATWWLSADRPVIGLTARNRKPDLFWFALLHEMAHIILHPRRATFLDLTDDKNTNDTAEQEADTFAEQTLLPDEARTLITRAATREQLLLLAAKLGVGVAIVAGHHGHATGKWAIGGSLRGTITDEDIQVMSEAASSHHPHGL
jgi:addiction module HigA family antidote